MSICLRNQNRAGLTLRLAASAWQAALAIAEQHGWNPAGTQLPDWLAGLGWAAGAGYAPPRGGYVPGVGRMVLLDDALNLADALERAFWAHEPRRGAAQPGVFQTEWDNGQGVQAGIGLLLALAEFCRQGPFFIET